jgi:hypothetical protein
MQEIKITGADIFVNPFQELEDEEREQAAAAAKKVCARVNGCAGATGWIVHMCVFGRRDFESLVSDNKGMVCGQTVRRTRKAWGLLASMHCSRLMSLLLTAAAVACCGVLCCDVLCVWHLQADAGNPEDPDNLRSSWFTNPGAAATAAPVRSGVGKDIAAPVLDAPLGSSKAAAGGAEAAAEPAAASNGAAAAAGAGGQPAPKKQKVAAAAKPMSNFDAW